MQSLKSWNSDSNELALVSARRPRKGPTCGNRHNDAAPRLRWSSDWPQLLLAVALVAAGLGGGALLARYQYSYAAVVRRWSMRGAIFLLGVAAATALARMVGLAVE